MKALLLLMAALWIGAGAGRALLDRLPSLRLSALERFAMAAALGLGIAAYGVFALGLAGGLSFWPVTVWWLLLGAVGARGMAANARDLASAWSGKEPGGELPASPLQKGLAVAAWVVLLACGAIAVVAAFQPPAGGEWDALAYHLAHPKVFLAEGSIRSLPTEHHSNFPYTMEMLFAVGLLYDGYALATLFHTLMGALTALALIGFGRRVLSPEAGYIAAILFVTTPLVVWEARVAYVELGYGLYASLAAFAALSALEARRQASESGRESASPTGWMLLAGLMMGFALGIKYLALLPFALLGGLLLARRLPVRAVLIYAAVAAVVGAPWYVKSVLLVSNPVYPYYYSLFPGTKYWSADRAAAYQSEQSGFGYPHSLAKPAEAGQSLLQTPWNLLVNGNRYDNPGNYTFMAQIGGLYAAFCFALAFLRRIPPPVRDLLILALAQLGAWFFVAQISRYLVSMLPLLALAGGYAAWRLLEGEHSGQGARWPGIVALGALAGQFLLLLWGVFALPVSMRDVAPESRELLARNLPAAWTTAISSVSVPESLESIADPSGAMEALARRLDIYPAIAYINTQTAPDAGVILFEDVRSFYLKRPYLWGNRNHSAYIPYDRLQTGEELTAWLRERGIRTALLNLNWSPRRAGSPAGNELDALRRWYAEPEMPPGSWERVVGDALRKGLWTPVFSRNGVVVLEIGPGQQAFAGNAGGGVGC